MAEELADLNSEALFKGTQETPDSAGPGEGGPPPPSPPTEKVSPVEGEGGPPAEVKPPAEGGEAVPSWRLREVSEARRVAEERAQKAETDLRTLVEAIQSDIQKEQTVKAPATDDFFANPQQSVEAIVLRALEPLVEHARKSSMAVARLTAYQSHGEKGVNEAETAFLKAIDDKSLDVTDYETVVQSPNRFDAVVRWHKRHLAMKEVGDDPAAYFERALESKLSNPDFQAKLLEKIRGGAAAAGSSVTRLPPSLSKVTSAARASNEDLGDMTDASLFAFTRK